MDAPDPPHSPERRRRRAAPSPPVGAEQQQGLPTPEEIRQEIDAVLGLPDLENGNLCFLGLNYTHPRMQSAFKSPKTNDADDAPFVIKLNEEIWKMQLSFMSTFCTSPAAMPLDDSATPNFATVVNHFAVCQLSGMHVSVRCWGLKASLEKDAPVQNDAMLANSQLLTSAITGFTHEKEAYAYVWAQLSLVPVVSAVDEDADASSVPPLMPLEGSPGPEEEDAFCIGLRRGFLNALPSADALES